MGQRIITPEENYKDLDNWIRETKCHRVFLVCDTSICYQENFNVHLEMVGRQLGMEITVFQDFQANPLYENGLEGVKLFREKRCDAIIAAGGGSAIDVAKCIKLYSNMGGDGSDGSYLTQEAVPGSIPILAMPTTAGTGSEATRYAVIYYDGKKQSIVSDDFMPDIVLMDPGCLKTLPLYQKKATMMDALCHAVEAFWSVNSTDESREYSRKAIELILDNMDGYLANMEEGRGNMILAANIAGRAINITQTTAGHAMCYKLTNMFGLAHGHAAILCDRVLFPWMIQNTNRCIDSRGEKYLVHMFNELGQAMGCRDGVEGATKLEEIFSRLELEIPTATEKQYTELKTSVNLVRLQNHPIALDEDTINILYHQILR